MLRELNKGIYEALGRKDIPHMASDLEEPKSRPGIKIYIKPKSSRLNADVRLTEYSIMILYYAKDYNDYYLEHYDIIEAFEEMLLGSIELDNGVIIELDELEFDTDKDMLVIYTKTSVDTLVDSESDCEVMDELEFYVNGYKGVNV